MWCVCGCSWRVDVWLLHSEHSGDGCDLALSLCKYDLRKDDLFVLSWARVQRVRRWSISLEPIMLPIIIAPCGYIPSNYRCMYMEHVCFCVCCSVCVGVCGNVCCVAKVVKRVFFSLGVLKSVVCLCKGWDGCCVLCLYGDAWSCRCSCMGTMSVSSCICCMFVSCEHPVAVLNAALCMTCSLLMLVEDARGDHMEEAYYIAGRLTAL